MPRKFLSSGATVNSDGYTPDTSAGKVTNLFLPRFNLTVTGFDISEFTISFMPFMVILTLIILIIFANFGKNMRLNKVPHGEAKLRRCKQDEKNEHFRR